MEVFGRGLLFVKECSIRIRPKSYSPETRYTQPFTVVQIRKVPDLWLRGRKGYCYKGHGWENKTSSLRNPGNFNLHPHPTPRLPRTWSGGPAVSTSKKKTSKTASSLLVPYEMMKGGNQPLQMQAMPSLRRRCVVTVHLYPTNNLITP